jgi:hypothetical protein
MTMTYAMHSLFRPLFFAQRVIEIRRSLHDALVREGRWENPLDQAAYRDFSEFAGELIRSSPLFSMLTYFIMRRIYGGLLSNFEESSTVEEDARREHSPFMIMMENLAADSGGEPPDAFQVAWTSLLLVMVFQVISGPGSFLLAMGYASLASLSPNPQRWLVGPLQDILRRRFDGRKTHMNLRHS